MKQEENISCFQECIQSVFFNIIQPIQIGKRTQLKELIPRVRHMFQIQILEFGFLIF